MIKQQIFFSSEKIWFDEDKSVSWASCFFRPQNFDPSLFINQKIYYDKYLEISTNKRQCEFLAGRYAAKLAFSHYIDADNILPIPIGKHGEPIWPDKYLGSISHSNKQAICAIAKKSKVSYLGIDIEYYFNDSRTLKIRELIMTVKEKRILKWINFSESQSATLIFSAKESIYKAFFLQTNGKIDLKSSILIGIDNTNKILFFNIKEELVKIYHIPPLIEVSYVFSSLFVRTSVIIKSLKSNN